MKKTLIYVGAAALLYACSPQGGETEKKPAEPGPHPMQWMAGEWKMESDSMRILERWEIINEKRLQGSGYVIAGADTVVRENLCIELIGNHWVYIAQINDYPPVLFTRNPQAEKNNLLFENPEHDYPQRIRYRLNNDQSISAFVEGSIEGKNNTEEYHFVKAR